MKEEATRYDQVNVRVPVQINDFLNNLVWWTKRINKGEKIPKEQIIQVALELLIGKVVDENIEWSMVKDIESLRKAVGVKLEIVEEVTVQRDASDFYCSKKQVQSGAD